MSIKAGRDELEHLERERAYVFHGSAETIEEFEPRQAHNYIDGQNIPDGEPAIFASPFADYAIFMALINDKNCPKGYHSGCRYYNGRLHFRATRETLDQLGDSTKGYVYVFNKSDFTKRGESEWMSFTKLKPIKVVPVRMSDFVATIENYE